MGVGIFAKKRPYNNKPVNETVTTLLNPVKRCPARRILLTMLCRFKSVQSLAPPQLGHQSDYYGLERFRV